MFKEMPLPLTADALTTIARSTPGTNWLLNPAAECMRQALGSHTAKSYVALRRLPQAIADFSIPSLVSKFSPWKCNVHKAAVKQISAGINGVFQVLAVGCGMTVEQIISKHCELIPRELAVQQGLISLESKVGEAVPPLSGLTSGEFR